MASFLENCESLGNNCEFGFVLDQHGAEHSHFFKWAFVTDFSLMIEAIKTKFDGSFEFENLTPFSQTMVIDAKTGIAYHTHMKIDGERFTETEGARRAIYKSEREKFDYLKGKFFDRLSGGDMTYVVKSNSGIPDAVIDGIRECLSYYSKTAMLIHVRQAVKGGKAPGTVVRTGSLFLTAYIDRFAPYSDVTDSSFECWKEICANAERVLVERLYEAVGNGKYEVQEFASLPPDFVGEEYLEANPGLREAGVDPVEHYLNFGWKEGRETRPS